MSDDRPTVLGVLRPDPFSSILQTGYSQFLSAAGVRGLCKVHGRTVEILAVMALTPGTGQFSKFMKLLKVQFDVIIFWDIISVDMWKILYHYDFREVCCKDEPVDPEFKGIVVTDGMGWSRRSE